MKEILRKYLIFPILSSFRDFGSVGVLRLSALLYRSIIRPIHPAVAPEAQAISLFT